MQKISQLIQKIIIDLFHEQTSVDVTRPSEQFGDYATNVALQLSKKVGKNPREVAEMIATKLKQDPAIISAEVAGPGFINVKVENTFLVSELQRAVTEAPHKMYGSNTSGAGVRVVCEFPSPNMAKPFSVGHIRSALQGWSVAQVMRLSGYEVITDNHVGDVGTPFGKWVVGFLRYSSKKQLEKDGINELARVYIAITADIKAEAEAGKSELMNQVQSWLQKLEAGDQEAVNYSKLFNQISFDHMHQVLQRLQITTDHEYGESYFVKRGHELTDELLEAGVAVTSNGAIVVDLKDQGIETPVMLKKANGTALYATTDLATMEFRDKTWNPVKVFIHTGQEQAFYFTQLNALAIKAGLKPNIVHLWHGLVDQIDEHGKRGKMSSRKGVILLNDLLDEAEKRAAAVAKDISPEDVKAIALGAIKFTDFTAERKKGVLFDWDTMFNVQGFSGPAVQYAAVRINSIVGKSQVEPALTGEYDFASERSLILELLDFPRLILELSDNYELHKLSNYLYNLARSLNRYYEKTPILKSSEKEQQNRLWVLLLTHQVLTTGLNILGIPVPKKM